VLKEGRKTFREASIGVEGRKMLREASIGVEGRKMWRDENVKSGCRTVKNHCAHSRLPRRTPAPHPVNLAPMAGRCGTGKGERREVGR
jgi:hypothetical protein